jgi:hypothetical protein
MRVRTGRFTTNEHTTLSRIAVGRHPQVADSQEPLALQPSIGHPGLRRQRLRQVPVALAIECREDRVALAGAELEQFTHARAYRSGDRSCLLSFDE